MKGAVLCAAFAGALLVGCGGGGGSQPAPVISSATGASGSGTGTSSQLAVVGHGTLSLKFTPLLHSKVPNGPTTTSKSREPAYVNGSHPCGSSSYCYLDVWVVSPNNQAVEVVNSHGSGGNLQTPGIQTLSIPLYAGGTNDVVAVEYDNDPCCGADILSIGETDFGAFTVGTAPQVGLTMNMSVAYVGPMSDPANGNNDASALYTGYAQGYTYTHCCSSPFPIYFFAADATGAFATQTSGAGGTSVPTVLKWSANNGDGSTLLPDPSATGVNAVGYQIGSPGCNQAGLTVLLTGTNPAGSIFQEATQNPSLGNWPAIDYLYSQGDLPNIPYYFLSNGTVYNVQSPTLPTTSVNIVGPDAC
jgi:hypothetical protein